MVLLDQDRVIGYQSFMLQDGGRRILTQALRINPGLKGKGVGRKFMQLCREFILGLNKEVGRPIYYKFTRFPDLSLIKLRPWR